jgi:CBS domain-containing protein
VLTTIETVLNTKGRDVWSLSPDATVRDAIELMANKHVEALVVLVDQTLVGILSERDCARKVTLRGRRSEDVFIRDIMSSPVVCVTPHHTVGDCMRITNEKGFAHLPVLDGETVAGIVSVGDLVNSIVREQEDTIHYLEAYVTGKYPA